MKEQRVKNLLVVFVILLIVSGSGVIIVSYVMQPQQKWTLPPETDTVFCDFTVRYENGTLVNVGLLGFIPYNIAQGILAYHIVQGNCSPILSTEIVWHVVYLLSIDYSNYPINWSVSINYHLNVTTYIATGTQIPTAPHGFLRSELYTFYLIPNMGVNNK